MQPLFQTLFKKFQSIPPEPAKPEWFKPSIHNTDDTVDDDESEILESDICGQSFGLEYRAATGEVSSRRITVRKIAYSAKGDLLVRAFCWERVAPRSFRADRIVVMFRLTSGEVIEDPPGFLALRSVPLSLQDMSEIILRDAMPGLRTLLFLSRCDGDESLEEREALRSYVELRANGRSYDWNLIARFLSEQHPDAYLAGQALSKIARDKVHARQLLSSAKKLTELDGEISPEEIEVLIQLEEILDR